jgi:glycosyltransferase involved in cell wall biosynthesis
MRVFYDSTLFLQDNVGGVARYFVELANRLAVAPGNQHLIVKVLAGLNASRVSAVDFRDGLYSGRRMPTFRGSWRVYKALNDLAMQVSVCARMAEPTILHETYYGAPPLWNSRVKRVITVYDMIWEEEEFAGKENWVARAKRISATRADGILFISESTRRAFHRHYPQRCAEAVVHLGSELRTTRARRRPSIAWPYVLFVGRREFYKNWNVVIDAIGLRQLWKTHGLVNIGGPLTAAELTRLRSAGIPAERVITLRCDDDGLADIYAAADCFVFPSRVEGFGIPLLEAARCGCPVACSDIPVFREILPEGPWYFDPASGESVAAAIEACIAAGRTDPLVELSRRAAAEFSWQRMADQTLDFYKSLVG